MELAECSAEQAQDGLDVMEAILGNEEGIAYIVTQAYKEIPGVKPGTQPACARKDIVDMLTSVMEVWKPMLNVAISRDLVVLALGPTIALPGEGYTPVEFMGFIYKVFATLKKALQDRLAAASHS